MIMAKKKKLSTKRIAIFSIGMIIGVGLIVFDQFETISGLTSGDITGLTLIDVPIDPTTGQILGTVKFGAPIEVPFERSGTVLSADGGCETPRDLDDRSLGNEVKFGRIASGDRNSEVFFHGFNGVNCGYGYAEWDLTKLPNDFVATGFTLQLNLKSIQSGQQACYIGFVTDTFDEIGERSIANRMTYGNSQGGTTRISSNLNGLTPIDIITGKTLPHDFLAVGFFVGNQPKFDNDWCESTGVKRWTFSKIEATGFRVLSDGTVTEQVTGARLNTPIGVQSFNQQLQFNQLTQKGNDKFMLVFYGGDFRGGSGSNVIDQLWWEENGSLLVTGSSQPIKCGIGFEQIGFRCVAIVCELGETIDLNTNQCAPIQCPVGESVHIIEEQVSCPAVCLEIITIDPVTQEPILPTTCTSACTSDTLSRAICAPDELPIGDVCQPDEIIVDGVCQPVGIIECQVELFCNEGFIPNETGCQCELIECGTGKELVGNSCQSITCPLNTILVGSDCMPRTCISGQVSIDNVCQNVENLVDLEGTEIEIQECGFGFKALGDTCVPLSLDCPEGTIPQENVCVKFLPSLPSLTATSTPEIGTLSIIGIVTFAGSFFGLVGSRRS